MFCTDESVNYLLNYSKALIDEISIKKTTSNDFKEYQYLIFAGMLSYYGFESIETIYESFLKTGFIAKCRDQSRQYYNNAGNVFINIPAETLCDVSFKNGKFKVTRNIYQYLDTFVLNDLELEELVHEVNHVFNSVTSPICKRNGKYVYRTGIRITSIDGLYDENQNLEEAINVLQSAEIMEHILSFCDYEIEDSTIATLLQTLKNSPKKRAGIGYDTLVPIIRPLYQHMEFHQILKENRKTGDIKEVRFNFDSRVSDGSFADLGVSLNNLYDDYSDSNCSKVKKLVDGYLCSKK